MLLLPGWLCKHPRQAVASNDDSSKNIQALTLLVIERAVLELVFLLLTTAMANFDTRHVLEHRQPLASIFCSTDVRFFRQGARSVAVASEDRIVASGFRRGFWERVW